MMKKNTVLLLLTCILLCASTLMMGNVGFAAKTNTSDSPFGFHPAAVIPPFKYGLNNPYDFARDIGVRWERPLNFIWTRMQPDLTREDYFWMDDRLFRDSPKTIDKMGNIVIGNPDFDPRYEQYAKSRKSFLPRDEQAYRRFVQALVERYDGDGVDDMPGLVVPIRYWQVENEPPHGLEDYAAFLRITSEAIKAADPNAKVLMGGIPGFAPPAQYLTDFRKHYLPILDELSRYEKNYFDIFDIHWFGTASGDYEGIKEVYTAVYKVLKERNLLPAHGFWIAETGTYSGDPAPIPMLSPVDFPMQTEQEQAIDVVKRNIYPLSLGFQKIFMAFGLTEGFRQDNGFFDFTGFIYDGKTGNDLGGGVKKLAYYTYKKMTEILDGADWQSMKTVQDKNGIHIYEVQKNGKSIWIAWNDGKKPQSSSLRLNRNRPIQITEAIPDRATGREVRDYATAFKAVQADIQQSDPLRLSFMLGRVPVYIQEQ